MGWLNGYVGAITGGSTGIGRAVAIRYLAEGAKGVVVLDRDVTPLADLRERHGDRIITVQGDVRDYQSHERMVAAATEAFGGLDVLVGNAGIFDFHRPLRGYSPDLMASTLEEIFNVNLRGYLYAAMAAREPLLKSHGSIIFTTSVAGLHAGGGGILYTSSKHAIVGAIRQLAAEFAPNVRVNGVGPGGTLTNLSGTAALGHADRSVADKREDSEARISAAVPLRFAQRPEDHAGLYVLLASRENSRATTGEVLMSDGGIGIRPL